MVFLVEEAFLGLFFFHSKDFPYPYFPKGLTFFQHVIFISDILHLFEVFCNIREDITIKTLRQTSRLCNFEDHLFISFFLDKSFSWCSFFACSYCSSTILSLINCVIFFTESHILKSSTIYLKLSLTSCE